MKFFSFFRSIGSLLNRAFGYAQEAGLTDAVVAATLPYIREANKKFVDNNEKREWAIAALVARKVPEGVARIAVELAYKLYRAELAKVGI